MKLMRRLCFLFLLLLTCTVFWGPDAYAQAANPETPSEQSGPIGAQTNEAVRCDELTDDQKKQVAEEAYNNLADARDTLKKMATEVAENIEADNGVCHYLHETGWLGLTEETADESGSEFSFSGDVKSGAQKVDEILTSKPKGNAVDIVDEMIDGKVTAAGKTVDLKEITDWSFSQLYSKVLDSSNGVESIYNWAKTAQVGDFMRLDAKDSKLICARVQCDTSCDIMYKHDANSYVCMRSSSAFPLKDSDGKCYENKINCYPSVGLGGSNCVTTKIEKSCTVRLPMGEHYKEQAAIFHSPDEIQSKVTKNENTKKCLDALKGLSDEREAFVKSRIQAKHALAMLSGDTQCSCTKNAQGEVEAFCQSETEDDDNKARECKSVGEYQAELADTCPTCELLAIIAAAAQSISKGAFDAVANDLISLIGIGFLIYIAYITLITIASPEAQKISKYLTTILIQGFKVAITILVLQNPTVLYKEVLGPILDGSVDFSTSLMSTTAGTAASQGGKYASKFDGQNEYLDAKTLQNLVGVADSLNREATMMPAIGRALICRSFDPKGTLQKIAAKFVPFPYRFSMWVEGVILLVFGYLILLALVAYMLDCMVELGLVCAIMAFCVACWPFKMTSNYTKVGWNMFLNVFFNFIMMGVIVTAIVNISAQVVSGGISKEEFEVLVNGDNVDALAEQMSIGGLQMLVVFVCSMMCLKLPKEIGRLANKFAGGAQISIGAEMAGAAAQTATKAAVGNPLQKGSDGKRHLGGAAGLALKGAKNTAGSIAEHSGLKGAASAAGKAIKNKFKGGKAGSDSFKKDK